MTPKPKKPPKPDDTMVKVTIRIPFYLDKAAKIRAAAESTPTSKKHFQDVVKDALKAHLDRPSIAKGVM